MKLILKKQLLEIGSGALRCGRWWAKHATDKKKSGFDKGWHGGKMYAYLYVLAQVGLVQSFDDKKIFDYENYLKNYRKGYIRCFPSIESRFIMKKNFFEEILKSAQPHQGKGVIRDIRRMCPEIK